MVDPVLAVELVLVVVERMAVCQGEDCRSKDVMSHMLRKILLAGWMGASSTSNPA